MEIGRQGSNRKAGWTSIRSRKPHVSSVEVKDKKPLVFSLTLKKTSPDGDGEYDFDVRMNIKDIAELIELVAAQGVAKDKAQISSGLAGSVRALNRLMAVASGIEVSNSEVLKKD
ncbi:hypothetical protein [Pseudomonas sp. R76]|uniref:hypothetical protein n=1 Tax=Pseudomonas sp. R76 TaxID=1573711 RepID=UPI00131F892D|nr:hypothetical protein [Pseudomonas sp. R76]QHD07463.1 hypothetical protein PspR76_17765 [Pseudomonas sp. R76]